MSLFRKKALDALSTPEQLDKPLELIRPSQWILLLSLGGFTLTILLWSIFGRIPVRVSGLGVLVNPNSLTDVHSQTTGVITDIPIKVGDCIRKGSQVGHIEPVSREVEIKAAKVQLNQALTEDRGLDALASMRLQQMQNDVDRIKPLVDMGAISIDKLSERQRQLSELEYSIKHGNSVREQRITEQINRIKSRQEEIARMSVVRAPITGCIVDLGVHTGEVVQSGKTIFTMQAGQDESGLKSLVFFAAKDGKRLKIGQRVRVTPTTAKQQRHGGIEGEVISIQPLPVRDEAVIKRLGVKSLLGAVSSKNNSPLIEVETTLKKNPNTESGYDWGGNKGPSLKLTAGTTTKVRVLVEERRPISYIIPILRDLTGIY